MLCSQAINTSCINCTSQIVIHFLLCVFLIVSTWTNSKFCFDSSLVMLSVAHHP